MMLQPILCPEGARAPNRDAMLAPAKIYFVTSLTFNADLLKPANKSRDTSQDNFTMAVSKELRGRKVDISEPPPAVQRQASRRPATRSATETFRIGYPSSSISGSQLPTNRQASSTSPSPEFARKYRES
ncbi:hypothetical protein GWK47_013225 [Chionoecetes opilio]|uniref:Uncharacterized protein n=1 Tax=Chionoecetes opilio TaxID=41210 RepID=A0A8J4XUJ6_CHIOP|nr:hypothetical protein GWK47_013225 [Chionoecetes opilio]